MLAVDEALCLGKVPPRIRVSKFVSAVDRSEGTLRNWLTNPPKPPKTWKTSRPPKTEFEESEKLLRVLEAEDPEFRLPVSGEAGLQIMQMRANMDERRYPANRLAFQRIYRMDMERWPDLLRKQEAFEEQDWDIVLCCFYYQLNLAYCGDRRKGLEDPELWDALTEKMARMADAAIREAGSARKEALYRLIKVSLLYRRIQHEWHWLSRKEEPTQKQRDSDARIYALAMAHIGEVRSVRRNRGAQQGSARLRSDPVQRRRHGVRIEGGRPVSRLVGAPPAGGRKIRQSMVRGRL